jgi:putative endonuclease
MFPRSPVSAFGIRIAFGPAMPDHKRFVYVLKSADSKPHFYAGLTSNVRSRLADHNAGRCPHTARYRPWQLHVVIEFADEPRAIRFERYLKSGSGRAFAKRHFEQVSDPDPPANCRCRVRRIRSERGRAAGSQDARLRGAVLGTRPERIAWTR